MKCFYIDDGTFNFESREKLKRGVQVIHDHFIALESRYTLENKYRGRSRHLRPNAYCCDI